MKANMARGWMLGCLVAWLGAATASCNGDTPPLTDLERGTMAATREEICGVESWGPLDLYESLGILLSVFPGGHKRGVDCVLAADNCEQVKACSEFYLIDDEPYADLNLPECGSERTDHCEGTVAKYCVSDGGGPLYQASFDCALAGATCFVGQAQNGDPYANCQAPRLQCEGPNISYCDGTRAVVCEECSDGFLSPWVYDCADGFGSRCVEDGNYAGCEGPATGEQLCDDGIDGDGDGKVECDDDDCDDDCT